MTARNWEAEAVELLRRANDATSTRVPWSEMLTFVRDYDQRPRTSTGSEARGRDGATGMRGDPCSNCGGHSLCAADCPAQVYPPPEPPPSPRVTPAETGPNQGFIDGRNAALANAAMLAYDMGHPDVRHAINQLFPENSPERPIDTPPGNPRFSRSAIDSPAPRVTTPEAEAVSDRIVFTESDGAGNVLRSWTESKVCKCGCPAGHHDDEPHGCWHCDCEAYERPDDDDDDAQRGA